MKFISHRGNILGKSEYENNSIYIDIAINKGYDVEIDVWLIDDIIYLGHDKPQYVINFEWLKTRINKLWIHCKNIEVLHYFNCCEDIFNFFWHQEDDVTLTSHNYLWTYPGKKLTNKSIAVLPENVDYLKEELEICYGICSDYIEKIKLEICQEQV